MIFDPVKYHRFERDPVGCFTAEMTPNGWANTKFDHDLEEHLWTEEVGEFVRVMHSFFKECPTWKELDKFAKKHGTVIRNDDGTPESFVNVLGVVMDYTFKIHGSKLDVFPYRKNQTQNVRRHDA